MSVDNGDLGGEEDGVLVAEYVLGLLSPAEHARMAARIAADANLQNELHAWQRRFQPLDGGFAEVAPPADALALIETRLFATEARAGGWQRLWRNLVLWRALAAAGLAVAILAFGVDVLKPPPTSDELANQLVASLETEGSDVKFVAFYNEATGTVHLVGLGGQAVPGRDYELWYIRGQQAPVSMGVIPVDTRTAISLEGEARQAIGSGTVLAVTLEPKGGSPTGAPTGPIVAKGAATPI